MFNGTNYQNWSRMVSVYLKMQGLWSYVSGVTEEPPVVANPGTLHSGTTPSETVTHETLLKDYEAAKTKADAWNIEDNKAMGIIALELTLSMQYLLKKFSKETWENIKKLFDTPGAAGIFVHFRAAINFKMDEKKDPSVQISKLQTAVDNLSANKFEINEKMQAMIVLASLPNGWDSIAAMILATNKANDLTLARIMPLLQEEWQRQCSRGEKSVHFSRSNIRQGPPHQPWQGCSNYQLQQAGSSNQPAPYKRKCFAPKQNNGNTTPTTQPSYGPNHECNRQNRSNKKMVKQAMIDKIAKLESNQTSKSDSKLDKGKGKAKQVQLIHQLEPSPLLNRIESLESYKVKGYSIDDNVEKEIARIDEVEDKDMVSLGDEEYVDCHDDMMYAILEDEDPVIGHYDMKYGDELLFKQLAKNHTVMTMLQQYNCNSSSNSSLLKTASHCNKTVCTVKRVIKKVSENTKICFNINKFKDLWIIDSGASHHITNQLSDFTEYRPYETPEEVQTANKQDSLTIHSEG